MKISDTVWQVGGDSLSAPGDGAVYLVAAGKSAALIDAGCGFGHEKIIAHIEKYLEPGAKVEMLLLTHCHYDHAGGAAALREQLGCRIIAHELDAVFLESGDSDATAAAWYNEDLVPCTIDHKIHGSREVFPLGTESITALHAPGHSPGSVVYLMETGGKRVLFGQDVHGPIHPVLHSDYGQYIASLTMLLGLEADILCEGHFGVYRGRDKVKQFIKSFIR